MFEFGPGVLTGYRNDVANSTPVNFGLIQEAGLDASFDVKEGYGQYAFPVVVARGKGKLGLKTKMLRVSGLVMGSLFFGQSLTSGMLTASIAEGPSAIPATPYQVTVVNAATFVDDLGVTNLATGLPFQKVASSPIAGQYSVAAGVYTFSSADHTSGISVLISYSYTTTTATQQQLTVTNQLMGTTPLVTAVFYNTFQGAILATKFYMMVPTKYSLATKLDDFAIPEIDLAIQPNASGQLFTTSFSEVS